MVKKDIGSKKYGAFNGVFVPTFLTIMGVILFLRLGTIVGSEGILGSILIILLAISVSIATGLALSSIITNIKVGSGGAYSIISKTLGMEVGGSAGIPLYLAQVLSVALYIFGFSEAWRFIFPEHPMALILIATFLLLFLLTFISTKIAMRTQIFVFGLLVLSILSIFLGFTTENLSNITLNLKGLNGNFWKNFALFFPAITGLMAGIGMSGELSNPKRQIPKGVISALIVTSIVYVLMVVYLGIAAPAEELVGNSLKIVDLALFSPLVLAGILASTFSSALATLVAAPRLLQALGESKIVPKGKFLAKKSKSSEPRNSILISGLVVAIGLSLGSLNTIAPILTMFFLIAYAMINLSVFVEQSLSLVSFRPTFKIPKIVALYGFLASIAFMFYINVVAGLVALIFLFLIYIYLSRKKLKQQRGDVRSGLFRAVAEWAARKTESLPGRGKHIWKPNIIITLKNKKELSGKYSLAKNIIYPKGTLSVLSFRSTKDQDELYKEVKRLEKQGIFTTFTQIKSKKIPNIINIALQAIKGQFFHPNMLLVKEEDFSRKKLKELMEVSEDSQIGLLINEKDLKKEKKIHVWIPERHLDKKLFDERDFDLAMLVSYQLSRNWNSKIVLNMQLKNHKKSRAKKYLRKLIYEARFPPNTGVEVYSGEKKILKKDLNIFAVRDLKDYEKLKKETKENSKVLFVKDSGIEDVLA